MTTKLTLTIEKDVIETAKSYAQKKGRSLSGLVENYLKSLPGNENETQNFSPKVKRLLGAIKLHDDFDYKETLGTEIEKKYGK